MHQFSIREVERLSGIKAHTLRVWEQRYAIIQPGRNGGKQRFYSNDDLKKILKIVYLYQNGYRISEIARLPLSEMSRLISQANRVDEVKRASVVQLLEAVVDLDEALFIRQIDRLAALVGFESAMIDVLFPLLKRIGLLWMTDHLMPGQEHFASNIILQKIIYAIDCLEKPSAVGKNLVLLWGPEGEYHEIGLLFLNYLLRKNGCRTIYLGANTSNEVAREYILRYHPTHIHLHPVCNLQPDALNEWVLQVCNLDPDASVMVSGPLAGLLQPASLPANAAFLLSENELLPYVLLLAGRNQ